MEFVKLDLYRHGPFLAVPLAEQIFIQRLYKKNTYNIAPDTSISAHSFLRS